MTRQRSPRPRGAKAGKSRPHRHDGLQAALVEKILRIADLIELKRAEGLAQVAAGFQAATPPAGPAPREGPCDDGAIAASMPR